MGMFDWVEFECKCPLCGKLMDDFQSKDGEKLLKHLPVYAVNNFYGSCDNCGTWIDFTRDVHKVYIPTIEINKPRAREYLIREAI